MISLRLARAVEGFWALAGDPGPFPRDIEAAVAWALPLSVVRLSRLHAGDVRRWLEQHRFGNTEPPAGSPGRPLCGCLAAFAGNGFAFVDGADSPADVRFTIAHEAAHFMVDYLWPRQRASDALTPAGVEVFDRVRRPTTDERVHALLAGLDLDGRLWLFERDASGASLCEAVHDSERDADAIACELLAPYDEIAARLDARPAGSEYAGSAVITELLTVQFGLPQSPARQYAVRTAAWYADSAHSASDGLAAWLGVQG